MSAFHARADERDDNPSHAVAAFNADRCRAGDAVTHDATTRQLAMEGNMKRMLRKGWFASLALAASPALAQEVRPVGYFQPIANLSRPAPLTGATPADTGSTLEFKSVTLDRPTPLVRAKIEIEAAKPLPPGPNSATPAIDVIRPAPFQMPTGIPMSSQKEFVPPTPKVIQPIPMPQGTYPQGTFPPGTVTSDPVLMYPPGTVIQDGVVQHGTSSGGIADGMVIGGDGCECAPSGILAPRRGVRTRMGAAAPWTSDLVGDSCGACAMDNACNECGDGGCLPRPNRFWVRGEYLLWSFTRANIPPLVTTSSNGLQANFSNPTTRILFDKLDNPLRNGAQFTLGMWLPGYEDWGLEGSFFFVGQRNSTFNVSSNGTPVLTMPYLDVGAAAGFMVPSGETEAAPAPPNVVAAAGRINITSYTTMSGFEVNLRRKLLCGPNFWLDGLIGYRNITMEDSIVMSRNFTLSVPAVPGIAPRNFDIFDSFRTNNIFNGGQLGLDGEYKVRDKWSLRGTFKLALGNMYQAVDIDGASTQAISNGGVSTQAGGVYALTTNIGHHTRNTFTAIPEFGLRINYDLTENVRLYAGYSALYLPDVVRAGQQIDPVVNSNFIPFVRDANPGVANTGLQRPAVLFNHAGMWAQGVNFGLEYHY